MSIQSARHAAVAATRRRTVTVSGVGTVDVGNTLTYVVVGLNPNTAYITIVQAYDSENVSGTDSSPLSITTTA